MRGGMEALGGGYQVLRNPNGRLRVPGTGCQEKQRVAGAV